MRLQVKICGINSADALEAAARGGARHIGLNFYPPSPRSVSPELAKELARAVPTGVRAVGLFVEPSDAELEDIISQVPLDTIQLHGDETPGRVAEIRVQTGIPVMKAIRVGQAADLDGVSDYEAVVDSILFDARLPKSVSSLPGGNGVPFDWSLLAGLTLSKPWMLSGGLTSANLAEAVEQTGADRVDTASGVEDRPGHKTPALIGEFLAVAANL
ncbi:MAG: phosphoribosylanthranilate isomerase [Pseudomonadota bacterium]